MDAGSPSGTTVSVINLDTNQPVKEIVVPSTGKFDLELEYFKEYRIQISKEGYYIKFLDVSTVIPRDVWEKDSIFPPLPIVLNLYKRVSDAKLSFETQTVGKISYSPNGTLDNFDSSLFIDDQTIQDEITTETRNSSEKEFDQKMAEALEYEKKNELSTAFSVYSEALKIKPSDKFVKEKLKELAVDLKNLEAEGKMQAEFDRLVVLGDENAGNLKYYEAIQYFKGALKIKANDAVALSKLSEAEKQYALMGEKDKMDAEINKLMALGEKNFILAKYTEAVAAYKDVLKVKPGHTPALTRIAEAENLLALERSEKEKQEAEFNRLISLGDENITQAKYELAIGNFRAALNIKTDNPTALAKLNKAENLLAGEQSAKSKQDAEFNRLITLGDQYLSQSRFVLAVGSFKGALEVKPSEPTAMARLSNAENLLVKNQNEIAKQESEFSRLLALGDANSTQSKYADAIVNYKDALKIKPEDQKALESLKKVENLLSAELSSKKKLETDFIQLLSSGDLYLGQSKYNEAITSFKSALVLKPGETTVLERIKKAESLMLSEQTEKAKLDAEFARLVSLGDQSFSQSKYDEAIVNFKAALVIKPADPVALARLSNSENFLANEKKEKEKLGVEFNRQVALGDQNLSVMRFVDAISNFKAALLIKPGDADVLSKISKAENSQASLLTEKAKQDAEFNRLVSLGDQNLGQKKYAEAISNFKSALVIKAGDQSILARIVNTESLITKEQEENARKLELYNRNLAIGDENMKNTNYQEAIKRYNEALVNKPADQVALSKIENAQQLLAKTENEKQKAEQEYNRLVGLGDANIAEKKYAEAIPNYKKALGLKFTTELSVKITAAEQILLVAEKERVKLQVEKDALELKQKKYSEAIAKADQLFKLNDYAEAKKVYQQAMSIDPVPPYPNTKISEIDAVMAALEVKKLAETKSQTEDNLFAEKIKIADDNFKNSQWSVARFNYLEALKIRKSDKYAIDQVVACDKMTDLGITVEKLKDYKNKIAKGDQDMKGRNYSSARFYYRSASDILSWETYPQQQLKEIDRILSNNLTEADKKVFAENLENGNKAFDSKEYSSARFYYSKAVAIGQSEFIDSRLKEIESIVNGSESIKTDAAYNDFVKKGNEANQQNNTSIARFYFQKANQLKPNENYPKEALKRIDAAIANP
jgi:cytochrome c-type biogenesis protein CcmH/NrfG